MDRYKRTFLLATLLISLPCILFLVTGIFWGNFMPALIPGVISAIWWGAYFLLRTNKKYVFSVSLMIVNLFWWPLLVQTIRRMYFVIENDGLEGANGYGSPLAFLLSLTFEQFFFIPISMVMARAVVEILKKLRTNASWGDSGVAH
jgi:hypothetical protein